MAEHQVRWCVRWWDDAWVARDERGTDHVEARDDRQARELVERQLLARFGRPMRLAFSDSLADATHHIADYPASLPDRHALRALVFGGTSPHDLRAALLAAGATPRAVSVAFCQAFGLEPEVVTDADIVTHRPVWSRPHQLRDAHARGASLVDALHRQYETVGGSLPLFVALRDAFDLEFGDTKVLLDLACRRDASFDERFAEALRRAEAGRQPPPTASRPS